MIHERWKNRILALFLGICVMAVFAGCGDGGEYITKAMELIAAVDYQGALTQLDSAEENGENIRLINRARGIACMGLTDYQAAIQHFEQAIADTLKADGPVDAEFRTVTGKGSIRWLQVRSNLDS